MGIAILDESLPYDIHLKLGLGLLAAVHRHNEQTSDKMRQFQIRVGINQNVDNIITDINGARNVAGAGINTAQRVMNVADGSQLLVGQTVFDTLVHREAYMKSFRRLDAEIKHGVKIPVHQFIESGHVGLSTEVPAQFKKRERRLTLIQAFYLAHALRNREFLLQRNRHGQNVYAITVLLWFLASDSTELTTGAKYEEPFLKVYGKGSLPFSDAFSHYMSIDFSVCCELASLIRESLAIQPYIEDSGLTQYFVVNELGRKKLKAEYPKIWEEFGLEGTA